MLRLLLVEIRRILSRGTTRLLTGAGILLIVFIGVLVFFVTTSADAARAKARADLDEAVASCMDRPSSRMPPGFGSPEEGPVVVPQIGLSPPDRAQCEAALAPVMGSPDKYVFKLSKLWPGGPDAREMEGVESEWVDLPVLLSGVIVLPGLALITGGLVGGASMVGAEWQAGTFVTLLTWEPRRVRLLVSRMIACALVGSVIALTLLCLFTFASVTAAVKGEVPPGDWWVTYAGVLLRLSALTGAAAVVGAAIAMIGRRTALAVAAIPAYLIGVEVVLRIHWQASRPWLLLRNLALVLSGDRYLPGAGGAWHGLAVLVGWSAVLIALSLIVFSRRDFASSG